MKWTKDYDYNGFGGVGEVVLEACEEAVKGYDAMHFYDLGHGRVRVTVEYIEDQEDEDWL